MTDLHPVKQEIFDLNRGTNTDPKGFIREVDTYRITDFGLYMARGANHPRFGYLETWLLPGLGLRVNIFHFREGINVHQDYYVDVAEITTDPSGVWRTRDLYVDLISVTGTPVDVLDIDELAAAASAGLITAEDTETAIETTLTAVEGITRNDDNLMAWLSRLGITLDWADPDTITLAPVE
ncbi:DUF402 domain-containing protein [Corynebacterium sp. CCM 9204]|uniref:DUF402 domain-containing protein n=1 Tax=Corynebacterium sp. CCM 9204 TaxID=3057616 RepID=UPI003523DBCB